MTKLLSALLQLLGVSPYRLLQALNFREKLWALGRCILGFDQLGYLMLENIELSSQLVLPLGSLNVLFGIFYCNRHVGKITSLLLASNCQEIFV